METKSTLEKFRRQAARKLRLNATDGESQLWRQLRHLPVQGTHFRRQVPIGPYIVDFACMAARLVIEVDGSQHGADDHIVRDQARTQWLEERGYRVIRFWNNEIVENIEGVLTMIYANVYGSTDAEPSRLKHKRRRRSEVSHSQDLHPTPARFARRPSPSRGG